MPDLAWGMFQAAYNIDGGLSWNVGFSNDWAFGFVDFGRFEAARAGDDRYSARFRQFALSRLVSEQFLTLFRHSFREFQVPVVYM